MSLYAGGRDRGEFQLENYMSKVCWSVLCCCCGGRPPLNGNTREYMYIAELHGYITGRISIFTSHRRCSPRPVDKPLPPLYSSTLNLGLDCSPKHSSDPLFERGSVPDMEEPVNTVFISSGSRRLNYGFPLTAGLLYGGWTFTGNISGRGANATIRPNNEEHGYRVRCSDP